MGKRSKTGVLKRLREVKKAEKAAMKREELRTRKQTGVSPERPESTGAVVATEDDMAGYGFPVASDDDDDDRDD